MARYHGGMPYLQGDEVMLEEHQKMPRSFLWLNAAQFGGALNDNIFKFLIIFFLIDLKGADAASSVVFGVGLVFVIPFLLFSAAAGVLADRYSKRLITISVKAVEILTMLLAVWAFTLRNEWLAYAVLFLMSTQSAFFSPTKYGIIPELVGKERLSRANSLMVLYTYLSIILGTAIAPTLAKVSDGNYVLAAQCCVLVAVLGFLASLRIPVTEAQKGDGVISPLFLRDIWRTLVEVRRDGFLMLAVIASAYFLLVGAFIQLNLILYGMQMLGWSQENSGYLFFIAAMGIGVGAMMVGRLSGRNIEFGLVPLGVFGVTVCAVALYAFYTQIFVVAFFVFALGISAGFYVVPLNAFIQYRSPEKLRGRILAASGFLSWIGVALAAVLVEVFSKVLNLSPAQGFLVIGLVTMVLALIAFRVLPDFFLRFVVTIITKCFYRIRVVGGQHVPSDGPALLVANHVSWVDALILNATQQRRIRFMMYRDMYNNRWLNPFFRLMGVIPISYQDSPKQVLASLHQARAALDDGYMVCIFAEGAITRSGMMQEFKGGFERIVRNSDIPVIPVYLGGVWGSIFSYFHGKPMLRRPVMLPYPVSALFGKPLPADTSSYDVRQRVMELSVDYFNDRKARRRPIGEEFIRMARHHWGHRALTDTTGKSLTFGKALIGSLALAELIERDTRGQKNIGLLLPSSVGGALANIAVALLRKTAVNLNYVASNEFRAEIVKQCDLKYVLTSRKLLEKLDSLKAPPGAVFIEDLLPQVTTALKLKCLFRARFQSARRLARSSGFDADELATIMFSSGSTGMPKGVMLSHHNILSNVEAFRMVYRPDAKDNLCASLPFFHSFGYTASLWFPLLSGFSATYHTNPLDAEKIAEMVREHTCTLLFATPTFLLGYLRKAKPEDFASLRAVIVGAEKLKQNVADAFEKRFGLRPLEGYGATECSPVISVNLPPVDIDGVRQIGSKPGTVGQPLPGVAVKVVDPESFTPLPVEAEGLLLVRGPNVMRGYLNMPEKTDEVLKDGWYVTGDIVNVDRDGFITITDRLARFSKIGGEMVPLIAVEEAYIKGLNTMESVLTVTSVPDPKRGERLMVLYTDEAGDAEQLHEIIQASDLPNLWKPDRKAYRKVDAIPMLGSGKLDFKAIRDLAEQGS